MFGLKNLRPEITVTEDSVKCPVNNCNKTVARQRKSFNTSDEFMCPDHQIYISPSTFEYKDMFDNLLWNEQTDRDLLNRIIGTKRESRLARDNSEDALTWNVFRFLEKSYLLSRFLGTLVKHPMRNCEVFYWSYSQSQNDVWSSLKEAREEFETVPKNGSEPDLIVKSDKALFLIEAKLTANNNTVLAAKKVPKVKGKYENGGKQWYEEVFCSDFETIAVANKKYELLRFWLLGSWIAKQLNLDYYLVNLTSSEKEKTIEKDFKQHIRENSKRVFLRTTWEDIYYFVLKNSPESIEKSQLIEYFKNKTLGYRNSKLKKAFSI
jgi:hypothetical protein